MALKPTKINIQLGHMGKGYLDPKIGVKNLTELADIENIYAGYLVVGQVTWVMSELAWYMWNGTSFEILDMKGEAGEVGPPGPSGNSFSIDAECSTENCLQDYCQENKGFTVLVTDYDQDGNKVETLYFKLSEYNDQACSWSDGTPFNTGIDGDDGTSSYTIFATAAANQIAAGTPTDSDIMVDQDGSPTMPFTKNGITWTDAPGQPESGKRLYMLTSENYKAGSFVYVPWKQPAVYIDGDEGKDAGIWTIWNDKVDGRPADPIYDSEKMDTESGLKEILGGTGWYNDVDDKNMDGTADDPGKPVWMATSTLPIDTQEWTSWAVVRVAGERPEYIINAYMWALPNVAPSVPAISSITYGDTGSMLFPDPTATGWRDAPGTNPSPNTYELWQTMTKVPFTGADKENITWAAPINVEGKEGPQGDGTAIWMVWTDQENPSILVPLIGNYDTYKSDQDITDYLNSNNNTDWMADAGTNSVKYSATCMYIPGEGWTTWKTARVKGENGKAFTVENTGIEDPWVWAVGKCATLVNGTNYLNTATSMLYFLENSAACDTEAAWSVPTSFGTGLAGATTYFYFKRSDSGVPAGPTSNPTTPGETPVEGWSDGIPAGAGIVYMTSITFEPPSTWKPWTTVVPIEGENGIEGAGIWTIFTKETNLYEPISSVPLPRNNPGTWEYNQGNTDNWIDDVGINNINLGGESPKWMAISRYDVNSSTWKPWTLSMVKGEQPAYKVNAYKNYYGGDDNANTAPSKPTQVVTYGSGFVAENGWTDAPVATNDSRQSLYMSEYIVSTTTTGNWSEPIKMDVGDGYGTKVWTIWFAQNNNNDTTTLPALSDPNAMITSNATGLATISGFTNNTYGSWVDNVDEAVADKYITYQAVTNYVQFNWTPWEIVKVKGENGSKGEDGSAGGTIIMVNINENLGAYTAPASPSTFNKEKDPNITAEDVEIAGGANTWKADSINDDAVYLAVMTFGYNSTHQDNRWSSWRVTKIKGADGADGASVPIGGVVGTKSRAGFENWRPIEDAKISGNTATSDTLEGFYNQEFLGSQYNNDGYSKYKYSYTMQPTSTKAGVHCTIDYQSGRWARLVIQPFVTSNAVINIDNDDSSDMVQGVTSALSFYEKLDIFATIPDIQTILRSATGDSSLIVDSEVVFNILDTGTIVNCDITDDSQGSGVTENVILSGVTSQDFSKVNSTSNLGNITGSSNVQSVSFLMGNITFIKVQMLVYVH